MPTTCVIAFNNRNGVFYSGQELAGTVRLVTTSQKTYRALYITIVGEAKVHWTETESRTTGTGDNARTETVTVDYTSEETYLNSRTYVSGNRGGSALTLEPGTYNYNFQQLLPYQLPTSYDGQYGSVKYYVKITIDRPFRFDNVFKQGFTVIYNLDLNSNPQYRMPSFRQGEESAACCCCCCTSGPIKLRMSIPMNGFVSGQTVNVSLLVENESNDDIEGISVGIKQTVQFTSSSPRTSHKWCKNVLCRKNIPKCLKFSNKEYQEPLVLSSNPQSTQGTCKYIDIKYYVFAKVSVGCCTSDISLKIPITIGSIPIVQMPAVTSQPRPRPSVVIPPPTAPSDIPLATPFGPDSPPAYNTIKPPSYFEAVAHLEKPPTKGDPEEEIHQSGPFVPKYPVYENYSPSAPPE